MNQLCIIWGYQEELSGTAACPRPKNICSINNQGRTRGAAISRRLQSEVTMITEPNFNTSCVGCSPVVFAGFATWDPGLGLFFLVLPNELPETFCGSQTCRAIVVLQRDARIGIM